MLNPPARKRQGGEKLVNSDSQKSPEILSCILIMMKKIWHYHLNHMSVHIGFSRRKLSMVSRLAHGVRSEYPLHDITE